jgi:hypothetical protein
VRHVRRPERVDSIHNCRIEALRVKGLRGVARASRMQTSRRSIVVWGRLRDNAKTAMAGLYERVSS